MSNTRKLTGSPWHVEKWFVRMVTHEEINADVIIIKKITTAAIASELV